MNSDLQALEDSFYETVDADISMEKAQEMLDRYRPLAAGLKENYPAMKQLGGFSLLFNATYYYSLLYVM